MADLARTIAEMQARIDRLERGNYLAGSVTGNNVILAGDPEGKYSILTSSGFSFADEHSGPISIDDMPRGTVAMTRRISGMSAATTSKLKLVDLTWTAMPMRDYRITLTGTIGSNVAGGLGKLFIAYTTDGSTPTVDSTEYLSCEHRFYYASNAETLTTFRISQAATSVPITMRMVGGIAATDYSAEVFNYSEARVPFLIVVEDVGIRKTFQS